jgi:hypothetical protein
MDPLFHNRLNVALLGLALIGLLSGFVLLLTGQPDLAKIVWAAGDVSYVLPVDFLDVANGAVRTIHFARRQNVTGDDP